MYLCMYGYVSTARWPGIELATIELLEYHQYK